MSAAGSVTDSIECASSPEHKPGQEIVPSAPPPEFQFAGEQEVLVRCVFDCGPPRPARTMTNTATKANPRWMCSPCNGARKAIENIARQNPASKEHLANLKRSDPELWKQKVRASRIRGPGEENGVDNMGQRRAYNCCFQMMLEQRVALQELDKRKFLNKKAYMAFLKYKAGEQVDTQEQQDRWWQAALDSPDILKEGKGDNIEILVNAGRGIIGLRERALKTVVTSEYCLESAVQVDEALAKLSSTGVGVGALTGSAFGHAGAAFQPGAAASGVSASDSVSRSTWNQVAPPPASLIVAPEEFAPFGRDSGGHKRGLKAICSDPEAAGPRPKAKAKPSQSTTITGELQSAVAAAQATWKVIQQTYGAVKVNLGKKVIALKAKQPSAVDADLQAEAAKYLRLLDTLASMAKAASAWTMTSSKRRQREMKNAEGELAAVAASLNSSLAAVQGKLKADATAKAAACRVAQASREKAIKPYLGGGTPAVLARWLWDKGAFGSSQPCDSEVVEEQELGQQEKECVSWTYNVQMDSSSIDTNLDPDIVSVWSAEAGGIAAGLRKLPAAFMQRLPQAKQNLVAHLSSESSRLQGTRSALLRLAPKGQPTDSVEGLAWAPDCWKNAEMPPEALRTFGSPWLLIGQPGTARFGNHGWSLPGMGQFINIISGSVVLVTFPLRACIEQGSSMEQAAQWLLNMSMQSFSGFANPLIQAATLTEGCTAWLPYGHSVILINTVEANAPSCVLSAPYMSAMLAKNYPLMGLLASYNLKHVEFLASQGVKPWDSLAAQFKEWIMSLMEDGSQDSQQQLSADEPLALGDTQAERDKAV